VPSLFLKELTERAPTLSALLTAHLGNSFTNDKGTTDQAFGAGHHGARA
jgi:hypothetical protein